MADATPLQAEVWETYTPAAERVQEREYHAELMARQMNSCMRITTVHRQFWKLIRTKGCFANGNSLGKLLSAGMFKASELWTYSTQYWNLTLSQMTVPFPGCLEHHIGQ